MPRTSGSYFQLMGSKKARILSLSAVAAQTRPPTPSMSEKVRSRSRFLSKRRIGTTKSKNQGVKHMRSNIWKASLLLAATIVVVPAFGQSTAYTESKTKLVGTWKVQVTQVDCQSGAQLGPPFTSLLTFTQGGTMYEDTENPAFGHGQRGGGQGTWSKTGQSTYSAISLALIKYTTPPNQKTHNPGFEAGQQTI